MRFLIIIILVPSLISCSTPLILRPFTSKDKLEDNSESIKVILTNDRSITFKKGEYTLNDVSDSSYIQGVGTQFTGTDGAVSRFEGSIGFNEIEEVEVLDSSYISEIVIGVFIGFAVVGIFYMGYKDWE